MPNQETQTETLPPSVARTSAGLRDAIFDEIDAIRRGESNPTRANAVAKLAAGVVETVRMELEVQKYVNGAAKNTPVEKQTNSFNGNLALGQAD